MRNIRPKDSENTLRNSRVICQVALAGTYLITVVATALLCVSFLVHLEARTLTLLLVCAVAFLYAVTINLFVHAGRYRTASYMLLAFYMSLAVGIAWAWGINTPIAPLLFGLVIVLAGILLTARHALYAAGVTGIALVLLQTCLVLGYHTPDTSWSGEASNFGDVFAYWTVFGMLALASWLYNREMESSLAQAKRAEKALLRQKANLALEVQRRTKQLRESQLEELQQMYRVAELGQVGISLLHDLANNLTALALEIEGLEGPRRSKDITHAREITRYLGDIVDSTRSRINGVPRKRTFNIIQKTNETIAFLRYKATKAKVDIDWQPPAKAWHYTADPVSYGQVISLLTNNAIDAYENAPADALRQVVIAMRRDEQHIVITIGSWSKIAKHMRKNLFKPFNTSKKTGMGLGLYIAKKTIEGQLGGTITLRHDNNYTEFVVTLPQ
jgi:signal transduction histidine kinase